MAEPRNLGPYVPNYPFANLGDASHVVVSQPFEVPTDDYVALALNTTRAFSLGGSSKTLYHVGDTPSALSDQRFQRFTRRWADKPAPRDEFETIAYAFPGIASTAAEWAAKTVNKTIARNGFTRVVSCKITYTYYRIAATGGDYTSESAIPLDDVTNWYVPEWAGTTPKSPFDVWLNDDETYPDTFSWRPSVPTRTAYFALGNYGIVVNSTIRRYMGPFHVRITRRVSPI